MARRKYGRRNPLQIRKAITDAPGSKQVDEWSELDLALLDDSNIGVNLLGNISASSLQ